MWKLVKEMPEEPETQRELTEDLLARLADRREGVRETAAEALAVAAGDDDWRPDELILCDGIGTIVGLLGDRNPHVVRSALSIIMAIASAGHEEELLSHGAIDGLGELRDHRDPVVREMAEEALWLLTPDVEERMVPEPLEED
jgi:HEAT repeats